MEMERVAGIEPASLAWKARALPLSYTRPLAALLRGGTAPRKQFGAIGTITHIRQPSASRWMPGKPFPAPEFQLADGLA